MPYIVELMDPADATLSWRQHGELTPGRSVVVGRDSFPDGSKAGKLSRKQLQLDLGEDGGVFVTSQGRALCMVEGQQVPLKANEPTPLPCGAAVKMLQSRAYGARVVRAEELPPPLAQPAMLPEVAQPASAPGVAQDVPPDALMQDGDVLASQQGGSSGESQLPEEVKAVVLSVGGIAPAVAAGSICRWALEGKVLFISPVRSNAPPPCLPAWRGLFLSRTPPAPHERVTPPVPQAHRAAVPLSLEVTEVTIVLDVLAFVGASGRVHLKMAPVALESFYGGLGRTPIEPVTIFNGIGLRVEEDNELIYVSTAQAPLLDAHLRPVATAASASAVYALLPGASHVHAVLQGLPHGGRGHERFMLTIGPAVMVNGTLVELRARWARLGAPVSGAKRPFSAI